jgi:UDP-glucose 4-epimerase
MNTTSELPRNWLITGGCGFLGSALLARLKNGNYNFRVVDDLSVGGEADLPGDGWQRADAVIAGQDWNGRELIVADVRDAETALNASSGADVIVHFAANTGVQPSVEAPRLDCEVNVIGTLNYLEGARANPGCRFVMASSGAPLGDVEPPMHEEKPAHPLSPYGASKLAGEGYCSAYHGSYGVDAVALRFGNVFGPGSAHKQSVVAKFIRRALAGEVLEIYGDGAQTRDFIYIDDLIYAVIAAAISPNIGGHVFQIASSKERTINEVAEAIAKLIESETQLQVTINHGEALPFEVLRNFSDTSKARKMLGFETGTDFAVGLTRTLDYFLSRSDEDCAGIMK